MRPPAPTKSLVPVSVAVVGIVVALVAGCTTSRQLTIHRGEIPRTVGTVVPHVIDGVPADQASARFPRELPFGYTEAQLPLGLTLEGLDLGLTVAVAILTGGLTAMMLAAALRRTPLMSSGVPLTTEIADTGTRFPVQFGDQDRVPVLHSATEVALPTPARSLPPVPHSSMAQSTPLSRADAEPELESTPVPLDAPPSASREPIRLPIPIEGVLAPSAPSNANAPSSTTLQVRAQLGRVARRAGRWALAGAQTLRRRLAALPRESWNDFDRRRSPFRENGEFWVQGVALMRMGAPEDAERHYWNGFYLCEQREWAVEAAECLRRLASLAQQRGDIAEARAHLQAAAATFEEHRERDRLRAVQQEIDRLPADRPSGTRDFLTRADRPAAADRA